MARPGVAHHPGVTRVLLEHRRRSERRRGRLPHARNVRQRRVEASHRHRQADRRQPRDASFAQARLARSRWRQAAPRARRRCQPDDQVGSFSASPGAAARQRSPDHRASAGSRRQPEPASPWPLGDIDGCARRAWRRPRSVRTARPAGRSRGSRPAAGGVRQKRPEPGSCHRRERTGPGRRRCGSTRGSCSASSLASATPKAFGTFSISAPTSPPSTRRETATGGWRRRAPRFTSPPGARGTATVKLLVERGAPVDVSDGKGRTPLMLAVRACVDSYWRDRRSPESVAALLAAGASVRNVVYPSGYAAVDEFLQRYQG